MCRALAASAGRGPLVRVMDILGFMNWWNRLARRKGKLKFNNQPEAADFVRRVHNENGGPNAKLVAMRQRYEEVSRANRQAAPRSNQDRDTSVLARNGGQPLHVR